MFDTIQYYYQLGLYTKDDVNTCVPMFITQEQANQITATTANQ